MRSNRKKRKKRKKKRLIPEQGMWTIWDDITEEGKR